MVEAEKDNDELEDLFATFDKQFEACEQKFNEIEANLKTFREEHTAGETEKPENEE